MQSFNLQVSSLSPLHMNQQHENKTLFRKNISSRLFSLHFFSICTCVYLPTVHFRWVVSCPVPPRTCHSNCVLAQFLWRETNVLDNWQLVMLPRSEDREFDIRWVHDNFFVSLLVICVSLSQSIIINPTKMHVYMYITLQIKISAVSVFLDANHHSIITHLITLDKKTLK